MEFGPWILQAISEKIGNKFPASEPLIFQLWKFAIPCQTIELDLKSVNWTILQLTLGYILQISPDTRRVHDTTETVELGQKRFQISAREP